jgi:hypothetical protein
VGQRQRSAAVAWIADTYRQIISAAMASGDEKQICEIAHEFYDRLFSNPVKEWNIGRIISDGWNWSMQLNDGTWLVRCCSTKQWSISDQPNSTNLHCKQHSVAEKLGVPLSYLEGLYDAVRSMEEFHGTSLSLLQEKLQSTKKDIEHQCGLLLRLENEAARRKQQLSKKSVLQRIMLCATTEEGTMAEPPGEAISVDNAKTVFKGMSGVYFIYRDHRIFYVGKAYDVAKRITDAKHPSEETDLINVVRMPKWKIHIAELYYIWRYRPPANGEVRKGVEDEKRFQEQQSTIESVA